MNRNRVRIFRFFATIMLLTSLLRFAPCAFAESRQEQLDRKISQILAEMPSYANTDAKKALYLHDYIGKNVSYELVGDHQTAFGALLDGKAVCAGYADAYLKLLTAAGIRAYTITGTADNGDGNLVGHAWTMLYLNGICVFTDVTWDDPFVNGEQREDYISYSYFQLSMEDMQRNHFPDQASKSLLPVACNHRNYDYYSVMQGEGKGCGIFNDSTTPQEAAKYFRYLGKTEQKDQFFCDFRFDGTDMLGWIRQNWVSIAQTLGLTGALGVSYQYSESDAKVTLSGTLSTVVNVTDVSLNPTTLNFYAAEMTAQLTAVISPSNATNRKVTYASSDPSVATVSSDGLVTAKADGTAVITVRTDDGGKTATCLVTVSIPVTTEPTETTLPPEPTDNTVPPATTEPTEATEPIESTEPTVPTETTVTVPDMPSDPATVPMETIAPTTHPREPEETIPAASSDHDPTQTGTSTAPDNHRETTSQKPATNPVPDDDKGSLTVMIAALVSGAGVVAISLILLRRFH